MLAGEALLNDLDRQMARLFKAGLGMTAALWPEVVVPNSVTRLARGLEAGVARLHAWRISLACTGADLALRFVMSWYPDISLDLLPTQRAGVEAHLEAQARRITGRSNYLALFAAHEEFNVDQTEDDKELPPDDFGVALDDPTGSSDKMDTYPDNEAALDNTSVLADPEADAEEPAQTDAGTATADGVQEAGTCNLTRQLLVANLSFFL